jgi:methionyl-tRNA formyltransferase
LHPVRQPAEGVTYAHKIDKAEARIDWGLPATVIERRLRAFDPAPGAQAALAGETLKVWRGQVLGQASDRQPGTVVRAGPAGIDVATGDGVLRLLELQRPGGKRLPVADLLRGMDVAAGSRFMPDGR